MRLASGACDVLVSWFFTREIPAALLEQVPVALGVHPSLLPRHRGPDPYFWAIDAGDVESGVTVYWLDAGCDTGPIALQERLVIGERNAWQLARALDRPGLRLLFRALDELGAGRELARVEQDETLVTQAPGPNGSELRVDWHWRTERVLRRIRALAPLPGLALEVLGVPFVVESARASEDYPRALLPGEAAIWGAQQSRCVIRTRDGAIAVERARTKLPEPGEALAGAPPPSGPGTAELNEVVLDGAELARLLSQGRARSAPGYLDRCGC